jgi:hypothetical protein
MKRAPVSSANRRASSCLVELRACQLNLAPVPHPFNFPRVCRIGGKTTARSLASGPRTQALTKVACRGAHERLWLNRQTRHEKLSASSLEGPNGIHSFNFKHQLQLGLRLRLSLLNWGVFKKTGSMNLKDLSILSKESRELEVSSMMDILDFSVPSSKNMSYGSVSSWPAISYSL